MARRTLRWSVFDGVKSFSPTAAAASPETLMAEVDAAIASLEHAHATAMLRPLSPSSADMKEPEEGRAAVGGAGLADEAYKAACASLAAGKPDEALKSLRVAMVSCPPEKVSALGKIRSLMAFASSQLQRTRPARAGSSGLID